jgi:hypothetical protein
MGIMVQSCEEKGAELEPHTEDINLFGIAQLCPWHAETFPVVLSVDLRK